MHGCIHLSFLWLMCYLSILCIGHYPPNSCFPISLSIHVTSRLSHVSLHLSILYLMCVSVYVHFSISDFCLLFGSLHLSIIYLMCISIYVNFSISGFCVSFAIIHQLYISRCLDKVSLTIYLFSYYYVNFFDFLYLSI